MLQPSTELLALFLHFGNPSCPGDSYQGLYNPLAQMDLTYDLKKIYEKATDKLLTS